MSIESFIRAMPKVELYLQLEGAMQRDTLLTFAEQNEVAEETLDFDEWAKLLDEPDPQRVSEMVPAYSRWLHHPDDLSRIVYDMGVMLSKQNVRYAEITINPSLYLGGGLSFDEFMSAVEDGRDRALRGWNIRLAWILTIPRDEPRRSDDIVRWASSATARKTGVVGIALLGSDDVQPVEQFERAFRAAEKKDVSRTVQAGDSLQAEGILDAINILNPSRLFDAWGAADAPDVLKLLSERSVPVAISVARALCLDWVKTYADYPLRRLYDEDVKLIIGTGMPSFYNTSLNDEYLALVEHGGFTLEEVEEFALNAVKYSFLPDDEKARLAAEFAAAYVELRAEHIAPEETAEPQE